MRPLVFPFFLALAGCPICPDGELLAIDETTSLKPNQSVQFVFRYGGETYSSPAQCGGHWYVNGVEGGSEPLGFISSCGKYTAPAQPPSKQPLLIEGAKYEPGTCADCCPYATVDIRVTGP